MWKEGVEGMVRLPLVYDEHDTEYLRRLFVVLGTIKAFLPCAIHQKVTRHARKTPQRGLMQVPRCAKQRKGYFRTPKPEPIE